jgi:hypothetical protein
MLGTTASLQAGCLGLLTHHGATAPTFWQGRPRSAGLNFPCVGIVGGFHRVVECAYVSRSTWDEGLIERPPDAALEAVQVLRLCERGMHGFRVHQKGKRVCGDVLMLHLGAPVEGGLMA